GREHQRGARQYNIDWPLYLLTFRFFSTNMCAMVSPWCYRRRLPAFCNPGVFYFRLGPVSREGSASSVCRRINQQMAHHDLLQRRCVLLSMLAWRSTTRNRAVTIVRNNFIQLHAESLQSRERILSVTAVIDLSTSRVPYLVAGSAG
ncbi:MAG: hypothetical protein Q9163_002462, partial [Psora crenata]